MPATTTSRSPRTAPSKSPAVTPTPSWTEPAIRDLVVELLAELLEEDPTSLRDQLLEKGSAMPVDSLDLFDILVEFRQKTGITIPKNKIRRQTMRSVFAFAKFVAEEGKR